MANLYDKAQYIFIAGANKSGSMYGLVPVAGTTNVTLVSASTYRLTSGSRTNSSGILENIDSHILRVDYSDLVTCPSYKFEPQRTNYLLNSLYLSGSGTGTNPSFWRTVGATTWSLANDPTSPIGTGFTGMIREGTNNGSFYIRNSLSGSNLNTTGSFTYSVYAKRSGSGANARNLMINAGATSVTNGSYFILEGTGSISSGLTTFVSGAFIEPLQNGWYRCSILVNFPAGILNPLPAFYITSGSGADPTTYTGNGTAALYLCAAQAESGSAHGLRSTPSITNGTYVTSYISTSFDANGTRTADRTVTLPSSSNSSAWTYFMAFKRLSPDINSTNFDFLIASGSGTSRYAGLYNNGIAIWNSGSQGLSGSSLPIGVEHKAAIRFDNGTVTWFINGSQRFSIPWPNSTFTGNVLIGDQNTNADITHRSSFYVRTAAMFNQSLSNSECQSLTTTGSGTV